MLERLRKIFIESGKSQTEVAKKTNVTSAYIWKILNRDNVMPRDLFIKTVCKEFGINEDWLRTGEGEPRIKRTKNQEIQAFANDVMELPDENFKKRFVEGLAKLNADDWAKILEIAEKLLLDDKKEEGM